MCKNNGYGNLYIYIYDELIEGKSYPFGDAIDGNAVGRFASTTAPSVRFETNKFYGGTLTITKLTPDVISGTFSFSAQSENADDTIIATLTEGRFDLKRP